MRYLALIAGLLLLSSTPVFGDVEWRMDAARAEIRNAMGYTVGIAVFEQEPTGVRVNVRVWDLPPGKHGFHIHKVGLCEPPDFQSAGRHFDLGGMKHGRKNPDGCHSGDLPNLEVGENGTGWLFATIPGLSVRFYTKTAIFTPIGTAVCIHAKPDDEMTDPDGNSGARIACGVLEGVSQYGKTIDW